MSVNVIQHSRPRRKRAGVRSWTARHILLLAVVIAGILAASWLAPAPTRPAPDMVTVSAPAPSQAPPVIASPEAVSVDIRADLAAPPRTRRTRQTARQTGIPLDAAVMPSDNYEILSAAELDGISQARN